jgi:hypothetical protein
VVAGPQFIYSMNWLVTQAIKEKVEAGITYRVHLLLKAKGDIENCSCVTAKVTQQLQLAMHAATDAVCGTGRET